MKGERKKGMRGWMKGVLVVVPFIAAFGALCIGRTSYGVKEVFDVLSAKMVGESVSKNLEIVILKIRLPEVILSMLVGAGLSCAGCAFQSIFSNPLATPDTLGIASGTSFGAALGILMGLDLLFIQGLAFSFGILAVFLTFIASNGRNGGMNSVVLSGIMIGSLFSALLSLVKFTADTETQLPSITYWLMGSMSSSKFDSLKTGAPVIIAGILILYLIKWKMNILPLSDDEAVSLGVNIKLLRITALAASTAITAACVSMCGQVGWIGLLVPHMCRMAFGNDHSVLIPTSISLGAVFMLIVDTVSRSATASEIPVSIITAIIGAPFFIVLMRKNGGFNV